MVTWRSPSTSREVASDVSRAPLAPARTRLWLLVGTGTVVGLVLGILVNASTGIAGRAEDERSSQLTAGVVTEVPEPTGAGWDFQLPVFNATDETVDARLVSFEGANFSLTSGEEENLEAGTWGAIPFSVAANCDVPAPAPMASVRVRMQTEDGASVAAPPLPGEGQAVREYHRVVCASTDSVPARDLLGVWIVEKVYGPDTRLIGSHLMRFDRDGSFVADPEGGLYSDDVGVRGRYRLEGELLTIKVSGGYGCVAPSVATWRVVVRGDEMSMVWVRGFCPSGEPGDAWVLRRVLHADGVPRPPGSVPGTEPYPRRTP